MMRMRIFDKQVASLRPVTALVALVMDPALAEYWRITVGLCAPAESFFRMEQALESLRQGEAFAALKTAAARWVANDVAADGQTALATYRLLNSLHAEGLAGMKAHWLRALCRCEEQGEGVLDRSAAELAAVAAEHPVLVDAWLARLLAALAACRTRFFG